MGPPAIDVLHGLDASQLRLLSREIASRLDGHAVDPVDTPEIRTRLYGIMMAIYGRIVARELQKKKETLNRRMADGSTYQDFLRLEEAFVVRAIGSFEPGPSFLERRFEKRVFDRPFDDVTTKNLLLTYRIRFESLLDSTPFEQSPKLRAAMHYIKRITGVANDFASLNLQENENHVAMLAMVKKITVDDPEFYRAARRILERQSVAVVGMIHEIFLQSLQENLEKEKELRAQLLRRQSQMDRELGIARKIQQSLLPVSLPSATGIRFHTRYVPMSSVGGDFYDVAIVRPRAATVNEAGSAGTGASMEEPGDHVGILIADASGHGVPAAFIAAMAKIAWQQGIDQHDGPAQTLSALNAGLLDKLSGNFLTTFLAFYNPHTQVMRFASGGHPAPMLVRSGRIVHLEARGPIIGLFPSVKIEEQSVQLLPGDRLVFYTDGLIEARAEDRRLLGTESFAELVEESALLDGESFCERLLNQVNEFTGGALPEDDITLVVMDVVARV